MRFVMLSFLLLLSICSTSALGAETLEVLFLGDNGHHQPPLRFRQLQPVLKSRGIEMTYTDDMNSLSAKTLAGYDALVVFANIDEIAPEQAKALLDYVDSGKGFVPLHCASFCFRNNDDVVALIGAQFLRHGTGVFRTEIAAPDHPIMKGFRGFESWDETYVHNKHNDKARTVLEYRVDNEGREPWTWTRTHGKGRVFYTAWGHDQRTWGHAGFQNLVERGIRWAAGTDVSVVPEYVADAPFPAPEMTEIAKDAPGFDYIDVGAKIPNYTPNEKWGVQGEAMSKMQVPLAPEKSMPHISIPKNFRLELFAAEPDLQGKPIAMAWDERGRLYVAETYDYPNELQPKGKGRDRIKLCEDTDGDGKADKFVVFADKLSIPTTLIVANGGLIVQDAAETIFYKDTNGDDVADEKKILFSGWGVNDTHGGVSNFQYGLDNWIWAMQGYNHSEPTVNGKPTQAFRQGFFRFKADGSAIEFIRSTDNNTWGFGMSEEGIIFGSTANRNPSVYMPIPNRYYEAVRGWSPAVLGTIADTYKFKAITNKIRQVDQHGGYTAAAGHALYTARRYPSEYWNRIAFVTEPTGHIVGSFLLKPDGSDFKSTSPFNLLASDDEWCAPIMAEVGPDGNVWVIDWYNFIVQHNPTPVGFKTGKGNAYESDLRDKKYGRIYRVVYGDESTSKIDLTKATSTELVETLTNTNLLWRRHAQRLLVDRKATDAIPALVSLLKDQTVDATGLNVGAIHALWTLDGLGAISSENETVIRAVASALKHPSAGVRRNALQVLPKNEQSTAAIVTGGLLNDPHAQVRLAALLALADSPSSEIAGKAIVEFLADGTVQSDRWLREAAVSAAAKHDQYFLASLAGIKDPSPATMFALPLVAEHLGRGGDGKAVVEVLKSSGALSAPVADIVVQSISRGWPDATKVELSTADQDALLNVIPTLPVGSRGQLVKLAIGWGAEKFEAYANEIVSELLAQIQNDELDSNARLQAVRELIDFRNSSNEVVVSLLDSISPQTGSELAAGIVGALQGSQADNVGEQLVERLAMMTPPVRKAAISVLLRRASSTKALLAAIDAGTVRLDELTLDQKTALASHPDKEIQAAAKGIMSRGGALVSADRQKVLDDYLAIAKEKGDSEKGKELFTKNCANCHTYGSLGVRIGPDLSGMAAHPKAELLKHILDPNSSVEGNFRVYTVTTADGLVSTGLLTSESKTAIELANAEGKKVVIQREEIEDFVASAKSLMPEGFEKQLDKPQMSDLLEFLTQRGQFVPLDLAKVATITSVKGMFFGKENQVERLVFSDWGPKNFEGVPFQLVDPKGGETPNAILLQCDNGPITREMPKSVEIPCGLPPKAIHMLSGVSGWGYPYGTNKTTSMIVRLTYADGKKEDHELKNGVHFADYISKVDVPESKHAFDLNGRQLRFLSVYPKHHAELSKIELVSGQDRTAPVVMAITVEVDDHK